MLLRLNRITDDLRLQHVLLQDEMVYTIDTNRLFIGDGETVGGQDVATMLIDGVQSIVDAHIARGVNEIRAGNYDDLRTDIFDSTQGLKSSLQQDLQDLRELINTDIDFLKNTISQNVLSNVAFIVNSDKPAAIDINNLHSLNKNQSPEFRLACHKGTEDTPGDTEAGDKLFGITFTGLKAGEYRPAANIESQWSSSAVIGQNGGDARLVFSVGTNDQSFTNFSFDHTGTLSAPAIKTGPYTTEQRDALNIAVGTIIYNSTVNKFQGYQNTNGTTPEWVDLS